MMRNYLFLLLFTIVFANEFHPALKKGSSKNPGVKMELTQRGLNYLNDVAVEIAKKEIPRMHFASFRLPIQGLLTAGTVIELHDIEIKKMTMGDSKMIFKKPNKIIWTTAHANMAITSKFRGLSKEDQPWKSKDIKDQPWKRVLPGIRLEGTIDSIITDISMIVTNKIGATREGQATVKNVDCQARISNVLLQLKKSDGLVKLAFPWVQNDVKNSVKPSVNTQLCQQMIDFLDQNVNRRLRQVPMKMPLSKRDNFVSHVFQQRRGRRSQKTHRTSSRKDLFQIFDIPKSQKLWIDYSLQGNPEAETNCCMTSSHTGEISWMGEGRTPFGPDALYEPRGRQKDKMFYMSMSDYIANSLLYHAYKKKMLHFQVTSKTPKFGKMMTTNCDGAGGFGYCIGDFVPGLSEAYPNHEVELEVSPLRAPVTVLSNKNGGTVLNDVQAELKLYVKPRSKSIRKKVLEVETDVKVVAKIVFEDEKIQGKNSNVRHFKMKIKKNKLGSYSKDDKEELSDILEDVISGMANNIFNKGIPLPKVDGVQLRNPNLKVFDRTMEISGDLRVDRNILRKILRKSK